MPTYCWRCEVCLSELTNYMSLANYELPELRPKCCGQTMRRDYRAEGAGLADSSRNKGVFPMVCENLGPEPVTVQSRQELERRMKEKGYVHHEPDADARARYRDRTRRFY